MPQQETERFSEAIHPLYHAANKPRSDFRETSQEQHHPSGWVLGARGAACGRKTTDHLPDDSPRFGSLLWGLPWLWFGWRGDHALLQAVLGATWEMQV